MIENLFVLNQIKKIMKKYGIQGEVVECHKYNSGHINDTYYTIVVTPKGLRYEYIFQRVNTNVFKDPLKIMHNIEVISDHLNEKYGSDSVESNQIMQYMTNLDGKNYTILDDGTFWRVNEFVIGVSYDQIEDLGILTDTGFMFGHFQNILSDCNIDLLEYTIPDFHNTEKRVNDFLKKLNEDPHKRAERCEEEIKFILDNIDISKSLTEKEKNKILPLRVTHNDTKCNNMLVDPISKDPICVLDLDTVMPGLCAHDYGDGIRCCANSAIEDEIDLDLVYLQKDNFIAFTKGFVSEAKSFMTKEEVDSLAEGAITITYELASRFLLDYLDGDNYFKISRHNHNLERARCQIKLAKSMIENYDFMCNEISRYYI